MILLPDAHRWPAFEKAASAAPSTALGRSASSATMSGFLPPSSRQTLASRRPARAGEAHEIDVPRLDERRACLLAEALEHVEDSRGSARLLEEARERVRGLRCVLRRLQDGRVSAEERGERLPRHVRDRRVGGDDEPGDSERLARDEGHFSRRGAGRRLAVEPPPFAGDEVAHLDRRACLAERVLERLSGLSRDDACDLLAPLLEELRRLSEDFAAANRRRRRPRLPGLPRGVDGALGVLSSSPREAALELARRRIELVDRLAVRGRSIGSSDPARDQPRRAIFAVHRGHHAVNPPSTSKSCPVT
jgi:hypothetical protein